MRNEESIFDVPLVISSAGHSEVYRKDLFKNKDTFIRQELLELQHNKIINN